MKNLVLLTLFAVSLVMAKGQTQAVTAPTDSKAEIAFSKVEHNFGTMEFEANGTCTFEFTSTGKEPILLVNVQASCGCTAPEWSKEPVKPGDKGKIVVNYNTRIVGPFTKTIMVFSNAKTNPVQLTIKGEVKPQQSTQPV